MRLRQPKQRAQKKVLMSSSTSPHTGRSTTPDMWDGVIEYIEDATTIAIAGHTNPDGDALGSVLGLGLSLNLQYPDKHIDLLLADDGAIPRIYRFLPSSKALVPASESTGAYDLFISVDVPTLERLANAGSVAKRALGRVCIDHHPAREEFAEMVVRIPSAAATSVLVTELIDAAGWPLTADIATCLLTGVVTDTGRFQYQNANPSAFACASRLVDAGAVPSAIALEVYQSQRLEYLRLESIVMSRIETIAQGRVAYSFAYADDLKECGVKSAECDGLIDIVRKVAGTELILFLRENEPGVVRGNLRSKGKLDISGIAQELGGGGHAAAAGFTFRGSVTEAAQTVLPMLEALL